MALTKPDVSFLVVMTTVAGYALGTQGPLDWLRMAHTVFGTTLIAAGTSALNHYFERDTDALMRRTASRPLPSGQLQSARSVLVRRELDGRRHVVSGAGNERAGDAAGHLHVGYLSLRLYAAQAPHDVWPLWSARFPAPCRR